MALNIEEVEKIVSENTLALICVNHFGLVNPVKEIIQLCEEPNFYLIEDLGYSFGSEYRGRKLGSFGDFSLLNFKEGKAIPIGGGMVACKELSIESFDERYRKRSRSVAHVARLFAYKLSSNPTVYKLMLNSYKITRNLIKIYRRYDPKSKR